MAPNTPDSPSPPGSDLLLRQALIHQGLWMNSSGLNQGTSGNLSARHGDVMLITPSAVPYDQLSPEMISAMPLDGNGTWHGPLKPSTEWRFHLDLMNLRADVRAVVHAHPPYGTALAMTGRDIPACHYMVAAFGGNSVRCAGYARYGTAELSRLAVEALRDRQACLLANHGIIAVGATVDQAMWFASELEALAQQYLLALQVGGVRLLDDGEIEGIRRSMGGYGQQG